MRNYQVRLDRIEAAIAPKDDSHVLLVLDGETNEQALARYANARRGRRVPLELVRGVGRSGLSDRFRRFAAVAGDGANRRFRPEADNSNAHQRTPLLPKAE
jgi:hypothetical protein